MPVEGGAKSLRPFKASCSALSLASSMALPISGAMGSFDSVPDAYLEYGSNDKGDRHLSDDEIAVLLRDVKKKIGFNGEILVVVDACHSGGSTRGREDDADNFCIRGVENFFVIPEASLTSIGTHQESAVQKEEWLTLSACTDYQSNTECSLPVVGRLTYALYQLKRRIGTTLVPLLSGLF